MKTNVERLKDLGFTPDKSLPDHWHGPGTCFIWHVVKRVYRRNKNGFICYGEPKIDESYWELYTPNAELRTRSLARLITAIQDIAGWFSKEAK